MCVKGISKDSAFLTMRENVAPMSFMAHNTSIALTSARPWDESVMKSYEKLVYIVTVRQKGRLIYLL